MLIAENFHSILPKTVLLKFKLFIPVTIHSNSGEQTNFFLHFGRLWWTWGLLPHSISHLFFRLNEVVFYRLLIALIVFQIVISFWKQNSRSQSQCTCSFTNAKYKRDCFVVQVMLLCSTVLFVFCPMLNLQCFIASRPCWTTASTCSQDCANGFFPPSL